MDTSLLTPDLANGLIDITTDRTRGSRVRPARLLDAARRVARRPDVWRRHVSFDQACRGYTCLHRDEDIELWLLCWDFGQDTLLHDHGGSGGAFTVVTGGLLEDHGKLGRADLRTRRHDIGGGASFAPSYVHNLVAAGTGPAVSVHAYSPPLTGMNFYCLLRDGLHHLRRVPTDSPEPDTSALVVEASRLATMRL